MPPNDEMKKVGIGYARPPFSSKFERKFDLLLLSRFWYSKIAKNTQNLESQIFSIFFKKIRWWHLTSPFLPIKCSTWCTRWVEQDGHLKLQKRSRNELEKLGKLFTTLFVTPCKYLKKLRRSQGRLCFSDFQIFRGVKNIKISKTLGISVKF